LAAFCRHQEPLRIWIETGTPGLESETQRRLEPLMESAIIAVVRRTILEGLKQHPSNGATSSEMIATTTSWAIYGAAKEWMLTPSRCPSHEIVDTVIKLVVSRHCDGTRPG
jgi:hypothetical protein